MVASRGPIPKRTEVRRRTNAPSDGLEVTRAPALPATPLDPDQKWCDIALEIYTSFEDSGQSVFFQASDWATLWMICDQIHQLHEPRYQGMRETGLHQMEPYYAKEPMKGGELASILKALGELGATEGSRRRLRIELQRGEPAAGELPAGVASFQAARQKHLGKGAAS